VGKVSSDSIEKTREGDNKFFSVADKFKNDIKKNIITAILAAFGFLIALVWRDAIKESVNDLIKLFNIQGSGTVIMYSTAIVTTLICVAGIIFFSRWSEKKV